MTNGGEGKKRDFKITTARMLEENGVLRVIASLDSNGEMGLQAVFPNIRPMERKEEQAKLLW